MAATRLIALHVNKGKTVAQCLNERLDYSQNPVKTEKGELISSYACDPETAAMEFLLSKRQYQQVTGQEYKGCQNQGDRSTTAAHLRLQQDQENLPGI